MSIQDDLTNADPCILKAQWSLRDYTTLKEHETRVKMLEKQREMDEQLREAHRQYIKDREEMERKPRIQINIY
jgi:hypothetical protein